MIDYSKAVAAIAKFQSNCDYPDVVELFEALSPVIHEAVVTQRNTLSPDKHELAIVAHSVVQDFFNELSTVHRLGSCVRDPQGNWKLAIADTNSPKVLVIGPSRVGKDWLITALTKGRWSTWHKYVTPRLNPGAYYEFCVFGINAGMPKEFINGSSVAYPTIKELQRFLTTPPCELYPHGITSSAPNFSYGLWATFVHLLTRICCKFSGPPAAIESAKDLHVVWHSAVVIHSLSLFHTSRHKFVSTLKDLADGLRSIDYFHAYLYLIFQSITDGWYPGVYSSVPSENVILMNGCRDTWELEDIIKLESQSLIIVNLHPPHSLPTDPSFSIDLRSIRKSNPVPLIEVDLDASNMSAEDMTSMAERLSSFIDAALYANANARV